MIYIIIGIPFIIMAIGIALILLRTKFAVARIGICCIAIGAVSGFVVALYVLTTPSNDQLAKQERLLFSASPSIIRSIAIEPARDITPARADLNLVHSKIVVTDRKSIDEMVTALHGAKPFGPNHPFAKWSCLMAIEDDAGSVVLQADDTKSRENGLVLYLWSHQNQGWLIANYRCDDLAPILEKYSDAEEARGIRR